MPTVEDRLNMLRLQQRLESLGQRPDVVAQGGSSTILRSLNRMAELVGSGFNEGLANVAGLPVDMLNGVMNAAYRVVGLPEVSEPIGGSQSIKRAFRAAAIGVGERDVKPVTATERFMQRAFEELGAASIPVAGAAAVAKGTAIAGIKIAPAFLRPFITRPGTTAAVEAVTAIGGGVGAQTAREISPESPLAEAGGAIAGGLLATTPFAIAGQAKRLALRVAEPFTEAGARRTASKALRTGISKPPEVVLSDIERVTRETAKVGVRPTTAQAAGDPGLLATERAVARLKRKETGIFADIMTEQKRQVRRALDAAAPEGEVGEIGDALRSQLDEMTTRNAAEIRQADDRIRQAITNAGADVDPLEANRIVRVELAGVEKAAESRVRGMFEAIDAKVEGKMARLKDLTKKMKKDVRKAERREELPDAVRVINSFKKTESLDEVMALRSRISRDIRTEMANPAPNKLKVSRLEQIKDTVDDTIIHDLQPTDGELTESAGALYEQARQFFRTEVADKFRRGTVARVLRRGSLGEISAVPESATVSSNLGTSMVPESSRMSRITGS